MAASAASDANEDTNFLAVTAGVIGEPVNVNAMVRAYAWIGCRFALGRVIEELGAALGTPVDS